MSFSFEVDLRGFLAGEGMDNEMFAKMQAIQARLKDIRNSMMAENPDLKVMN